MDLSGTMALQSPLMADGGEIKELRYDFSKLTAKDFLIASRPDKMNEVILVPAGDTGVQLRVFFRAVMCADPKLDESDLLRMSFLDAQKASALSRNFMLGTGDA